MNAGRTLRALLVDISEPRQDRSSRALTDAGWTVHTESARGTDALSAALARRGWRGRA